MLLFLPFAQSKEQGAHHLSLLAQGVRKGQGFYPASKELVITWRRSILDYFSPQVLSVYEDLLYWPRKVQDDRS